MLTVVCIMLANGRTEMVRRAVESFHAQEYPAKQLVIWNTGGRTDFYEHEVEGVVAVVYSPIEGSIGMLRNRANAAAVAVFPEVDVYAHWDSDDWSHPRRLVEQVALLENCRADLVGYREGLFWDSTAGEAWIYRNGNPAAPFGASFLYPREMWERSPFPSRNVGEDTLWLLQLSGRKIFGVPSTFQPSGLNEAPRMICGIHGDNTSSRIQPGVKEWSRAPQFDEYCRGIMAL